METERKSGLKPHRSLHPHPYRSPRTASNATWPGPTFVPSPEELIPIYLVSKVFQPGKTHSLISASSNSQEPFHGIRGRLVLPPSSAPGEAEAQREDLPPWPVPSPQRGLPKHSFICSDRSPHPAKGGVRLAVAEGFCPTSTFSTPPASIRLHRAAHQCSVQRVQSHRLRGSVHPDVPTSLNGGYPP